MDACAGMDALCWDGGVGAMVGDDGQEPDSACKNVRSGVLRLLGQIYHTALSSDCKKKFKSGQGRQHQIQRKGNKK